jgi:hypothetical protein
MGLFTRYREVERKSGAILNVEWQIMRGGFLHLGANNWTFLHRFAVVGASMFGKQKEFILRWQIALDFEPRFSWVTIELINLFEARIAYIWIKVWKNRNLKLVLNFGWRLTSESKRMLQNQIIEQERRGLKEMRKQEQAIKANGGGIHGTVPR